jgi:DNA-binding transcriptional ArsR family regulator
MAELDLIAPPQTVTVTLSLAPAYNAINSLWLLDDPGDCSGLSEWVYQTVATLSPERLHTNALVLSGLSASVHLAGEAWPSFPAWLDDLAARDPVAMRDYALHRLSARAARSLGDEVPTPARLLEDRATYLALIEHLHHHKGKEEPLDASFWEEVHGLLSDPPAMQELMVMHLRTMWDEVMAPEWERNLPTLEESVAAFETLDLTGLSVHEALRRVARRELPADWEDWQADVDEIVFIPSAHIGPYLMLLGLSDTAARIAFGAHIPEGALVSSPELSRSELLMRLNALANDVRLRILELLAQEGELSAQDIITRLKLSQSAASRHLHQLSATGYLAVRQHEGAKYYRLSPDRIDYTLKALKEFCCGDASVCS